MGAGPGTGPEIRYTFKNVAFSWLIFSTRPCCHNDFLVFLSRCSYIDTISTIKSLWLYGRVEKMSLKIAFYVIIFVFLSHDFQPRPYSHIPLVDFLDSFPPRLVNASKKSVWLQGLFDIFTLKVSKKSTFRFVAKTSVPRKSRSFHRGVKIFCKVHQTNKMNKISKYKQIMRGSLPDIFLFSQTMALKYECKSKVKC